MLHAIHALLEDTRLLAQTGAHLAPVVLSKVLKKLLAPSVLLVPTARVSQVQAVWPAMMALPPGLALILAPDACLVHMQQDK